MNAPALPASLQLNGPGDSRIAASAFGAQALSWHCRGRERLYLSPSARFGAGQAIRGGVPVIFPQFAQRGDGPRHGFARTLTWEAEPQPQRLSFRLSDREETRRHWPHRFEAALDLEPGEDRLRIALTVRNADRATFEFSAALHTYLAVADIDATLVHGLEDRAYVDSAHADAACPPSDAPVRFDGEVDRIYADTRRPLRITDGEHMLRCEAEGFADTVVWNPGAGLAAGMADLQPDGHRRFVCVEAAQVLQPVRLEPGQAWTGAQILIVESSSAQYRIGG